MLRAPLPENELERLLSLHEHDVLDTPPEQCFDRITALAAQLCEAPMAAISLLDHDRQWFKSLHGFSGLQQLPRELAICCYTILGSSVFEVADAGCDVRFRDNPLVSGAAGVRFYAGAPVRDRRGLALGSLCVIDSRPRRLTQAQHLGLADLAGLAGTLLQQRPEARRLRQAEERLTALAQVAEEVFWEWDLRTDMFWLSDKFVQLTGIRDERLDGTTWFELVHPDDRERVRGCVHSVMLGGDRVYSDEYRIRTAGGTWLSVLDRGQVIRDAAGNALRIIGCLTDVTWRRDEQRQIGRRDRRQGLIARLGQQALEDTDSDALMQQAVHLVAEAFDTRWCRVLEITEQGRELVPRAAAGAVPAMDAPAGHAAQGEGALTGRVDALISGPQGPLGVVEMQLTDPAGATADARHFLLTVANIIGTALMRRRADQRLAYVAQFDALTGLPNRQLFRDRVEQSITRAARRGRPV
ncbi:MAG TPA: PAS domain-containing protein, partial [Steroidobacteraceae bacterium]|nr:PAS domain-containing protein [Steroidobacteraceae bacterium]